MSNRIKVALARARRRLLGPDLGRLRLEQERRQFEHDRIRVALGALAARQVARPAASCEQAEFCAFSQFGEDGIIEFLVERCDVAPSSFVEIGVETYAEANTRFLAEHRLWRGLIVDQNPRLAADLAITQLDWKAQVQAVSAFVTVENVTGLVEPFVGGDGLGLLSVDVDGVDYWLLEQLVGLEPALVIAEYNSLFGPDATVTVPYRADFDRTRPDHHNVYYGASLGALDHLLAPRGYALVACSTAGNNAFFVRSDRLRDVPARSVAEAFRPRRFVEHRTRDGVPTGIVDPRRQLADVAALALVDVRDDRPVTVADLLG